MRPRHGIRLAGKAFAVALLTASLAACGPEDDGSDAGSSNSETETSSPDGDTGDSSETAPSDNSPKPKSSDGADESDKAQTTDKPTSKPKRPPGATYRVTDVVDGDTVHLAKPGETSIRIIGIDTPETVHPSEPDECGGPAASKAAERLLSGQRVRLVYDPSQGRTDSYGRVLGYLQIPGVGDYGLRMITRGLAAEYTYDTAYRKQAQYVAAQSRAQDAGHGVWNRCGGVDTPLQKPTTEPETDTPPDDQGGGCAPGYSPCIPPYPPDLDCDDVDGPITITGDDPHGFDADGDGIGCDT